MKLKSCEKPDTCLKYLVETDFGEFGITDIPYGEESSLIVIKKNDEFAIASTIMYCCRGDFDYDKDKIILGNTAQYYETDDGEIDEDKAYKEVCEIMDFVCKMYHEAQEENEEAYDIIYKFL